MGTGNGNGGGIIMGALAGLGLAWYLSTRERLQHARGRAIGHRDREYYMPIYLKARAQVVPPAGPDGMQAQVWFPPYEEWIQQHLAK